MSIDKKKITLKEWMIEHNIDDVEMAKIVGCHRKSIENWCGGIYKPHKLLRREILRATNYEIKI